MVYDNTEAINSARQRETDAKNEARQRKTERKALNKAASAEKKKSREATKVKKAAERLEKVKDETDIIDFTRSVDYRGRVILFNDRPNAVSEAQAMESRAKAEAKQRREETKAAYRAISAERKSRIETARTNRANKRLEMSKKHSMISDYANRIGYDGHIIFADLNERPDSCRTCGCRRRPIQKNRTQTVRKN